MSTAAVIAAAALVAAAVLAVAWPFVSTRHEPPEPSLDEAERRHLELAERRDAAYAALRDLEQDAREGRVAPEDYEAERARLRAEAGAALRELDRLGTIQAVPAPAPHMVPPQED